MLDPSHEIALALRSHACWLGMGEMTFGNCAMKRVAKVEDWNSKKLANPLKDLWMQLPLLWGWFMTWSCENRREVRPHWTCWRELFASVSRLTVIRTQDPSTNPWRVDPQNASGS